MNVIDKVLLGSSEMLYCCGCDRLDIKAAVIVGYVEGYDVILCDQCLTESISLLPPKGQVENDAKA